MDATDRIQLQSWIRRRDADAFKHLTHRYSALVYRTCLRITSDPGDAEDLTQECFAALAGQARAPHAPLGAWLHRVATNRALNRVKARRRQNTREAEFAARQADSVEIQWSDIDAMIDEAIADLPEELRAVVIAHFLQSESYTSIAERLGTTRQTATNRVQRGVARIREALRTRGVPVSVAALSALLSAAAVATTPVPASVTASLGKLAVSGLSKAAAVECSNSIATTTHTLGGLAAMKSSIATAGAVVVLLAGGAVASNTIHAQREELQRARTENRVLAARAAEVHAIETELQQARSEVARLRERPSPARAMTGSAQGEPTDAGAVFEARQVGNVAVPVDENAKSVDLAFPSALNLASFQIDGPVQEAQILRATADRYWALFSLLKLPGEVQSKVRAALTAHVRAQFAAGMSTSDLYNGATDTQYLRETLGALLTPEEMMVWEAFESDVPYYHAQQEYVTEMTRFIPALTPNNLSLASSVLADEKLLSQEWMNDIDDLSRTDRLAEQYAAFERARARLSETVTDPGQFALMSDYIQQQQAIIQAQIDQAEQGGRLYFDLGAQMEFLTLSVGAS